MAQTRQYAEGIEFTAPIPDEPKTPDARGGRVRGEALQGVPRRVEEILQKRASARSA